MRLQNLKKNLLCFLLIFGMLAGEVLPVYASQPGEVLGQAGAEQQETQESAGEAQPPEGNTETPPEGNTETLPEENAETLPEENAETLPEEEAQPLEEEEESSEEEQAEELENLLLNDSEPLSLTAGVQDRIIDPSSKLEYTKKISKNPDGTYKLSLTVKAPKVEPKDVLVILDLSASMVENTDVEKDSYIYKAYGLVDSIQGALKSDPSEKSRMALAGFYGWAGKNRRTGKGIENAVDYIGKDGIKYTMYHGYEYPVYVTFDEWANNNLIQIDNRPKEDEKGNVLEVEYPDVRDKELADISVRKIIPNFESLKNGKIPVGSLDGGIPPDYNKNEGNPYSLFYDTNWEAGMLAGYEILQNSGSDNPKKIVFITDGLPTTTVAGDDLLSGKQTGSNTSWEYCGGEAAVVRGKILNEIDSNAQFITTLIGTGKWGDDDKTHLIGFPAFGKQLTQDQVDALRAKAELSDGKNILIDGLNLDIGDIMKRIEAEVLNDYFHDIKITDELTKWADALIDDADKDITVTKVREGSNKNPTDVLAEKSYAGKKVTVTIPGYLEPGATYTVSFDIKPSQEAYDTYAQNPNPNQGYPDTGDPDTCGDRPDFSSGQKGFYSNTRATLDYSLGGKPGKQLEYPRPVFQVELLDIPVTKIWKLQDQMALTQPKSVTLELFLDDNQIAFQEVILNNDRYNLNLAKGKFTNVPPGHKYSIREKSRSPYKDYHVTYEPEFYGKNDPDLTNIGFTVTNTELISIPVKKTWNVSFGKPGSLIIGIGTELDQSTDIATVDLSGTGDTWNGTIKVPCDVEYNKIYYIKEYWTPANGKKAKTTCELEQRRTKEEALEDTSRGIRYIKVDGNSLLNLSGIHFQNTELFDVTVGKTWNALNKPESLTVNLKYSDSYTELQKSVSLNDENQWKVTIEDIEYAPKRSYLFVEDLGDNQNYNTIIEAKTAENGEIIQSEVFKGGKTRSIVLTSENMLRTKHIQFTNTEKHSITIKKEWVDRGSSPHQIDVTIKKSGTVIRSETLQYPDYEWIPEAIEYDENSVYEITESSRDDYISSWEAYNSSGTMIASGKGTVAKLSSNIFMQTSVFKFVNAEKQTLKVEKEWVTPDETKIPNSLDVEIEVRNNNLQVVDTYRLTLKKESGWKGEISIPYKENIYSYTVSEKCPEGYSSRAEALKNDGTSLGVTESARIMIYDNQLPTLDKVRFVNTAQKTIQVHKTWIGGKEPSLEISMPFATGDEKIMLNESNNWTETVTVNYIPNISYSISEEDLSAEGYVSSIKIGDQTCQGYAVKGLTWEQLADKIEFTNAKTGELTVTKEVKDSFGNQNSQFEIKIEILDKDGKPTNYSETVSYAKGDAITFVDGVAMVQLGHKESITVPKIPIGYRYKVTENDYQSQGYTTSYQVNGGEATTGGSAEGSVSAEETHQEVLVVNTKGDFVATGIRTDVGSFLGLLAVAFVGITAYFVVIYKRKKI